jgi:NTE family protein
MQADGRAAGRTDGRGDTAFVLGGGGLLGAVEVGMLRALFEADIRPDLILGTSVGALNGALVAADPGPGVIDRLVGLWHSAASTREVYGDGAVRQVRRAVRTGTHLHSSRPLRERLAQELGDLTFAELAVPFQCVAASVERAAEHWFTTGSLTDAVLASCAVPGLLPPVEVGGETFLDGGLVHSIPVGRAVALGARTVYVLQVGRIERPLRPPRRPWEVGLVAFEVARRHRFAADMASLPAEVTAHVLPTGLPERPADLRSQLRYRDSAGIDDRMDSAYAASAAYLRGVS